MARKKETNVSKNLTYKGVGVDYSAMDPFKRAAQTAARETAANLLRFGRGGFREFEPSRGESAYLIESRDAYMAHVEEGLGTKVLVADAMYKLTGKSYYDQIAKDTVAMIVNDMVTLGALPLSVAMHLAVGDSDWFNDEKRCHDLVAGWKSACDEARCVWGPGETPTLKGVPYPILSGSSMGIVQPKSRLLCPEKIREGDVIMLIRSSGIHANGLTLARAIAEKLPEGYLTRLSDGRTYGEALLSPTHIYVGLIEDLLNDGVDIHYAVNITGHGWRKLMRAPQSFIYLIERLPYPDPIFRFIQHHGPVDDYEAYGNFNMSAGFALYIAKADLMKFWDSYTARKYWSKFGALNAGHVLKGKKQVYIQQKDITYTSETLEVR